MNSEADWERASGLDGVRGRRVVSKQNLEELAFEDRKKVLDCFNYSDSIRQNGCLFVENQDDANRAISLLSKNSGVCGIMLKDNCPREVYK